MTIAVTQILYNRACSLQFFFAKKGQFAIVLLRIIAPSETQCPSQQRNKKETLLEKKRLLMFRRVRNRD
ncbi:hypothetical protein C5Y93_29860 [Blastopirellula marina]|uniref:Uncharacterized protein n=1 Tax=Blastopirellula marina TaxID=124 RepID=A0A2S8GB48_9BACT|nr:hypothetical protein C5Y93_29860 [Blastopirellula marina]